MDSLKTPGSHQNNAPLYINLTLSIKKSRVRRTILKYLYHKGEKGCEVAELARVIHTEKTYVYGAIKGYSSGFNTDRSLLALGLVEEISPTGRKKANSYRLTEYGKTLVENDFE